MLQASFCGHWPRALSRCSKAQLVVIHLAILVPKAR